MNYKAHSALLLEHGPYRSSGFQWLRLARQLLTEGVAVLKEAKWHDYRRDWKDYPKPDIHKETTYDHCVALTLMGQHNGLLALELALYEGQFDGEANALNCSFLLSDVSLAARGLIALTTGGSSQTDLDRLLLKHLRWIATVEVERKENEAREKQLQEEEAALLNRYS